MPVWTPYAVTAALMTIVAVLGIRATEIGPWYRSLDKPAWQPPDWLFGPAWTTIYVCITWSTGRAWLAMSSDQQTIFAVLFALNLVLNVLWSFLFFAWRRPAIALVEVVPLWLSIAALMMFLWPIDRLSAWLLLPYLVWVGFAANLNRVLVKLNPDAHRRLPDEAQHDA